MATTYTVALQNKVSGEAQKALADVERLTSALNAAESRRAKPAFSPPSGADWEKTARLAQKAADKEQASQAKLAAASARAAQRADAQQLAAAQKNQAIQLRAAQAAQRAADREQTAQLRLNAEAIRSAQRMEDQKRNAAFRRLQAQQREEERFTRYRISLMKKEELARQRAAAKAGASVKPQGGAFGNMLSGLGGGLIAGGAGAAAVAGAAYVGGQALDAVKLIESARMRLTTSLGSVERANREMKDAFKIAEKTVFDPDEMVMAMARLATYFKDDTTRRYILGSVADFATQSGMGTEGLNRAIKAITDIKSKGALQAEELKTQLGDLGLSGEEVKQEIAKLLNLKGKTDQERNEKVMKLMQKGAVQAEVGIQAITTVMRKQAGGGKAGEFSIKSAGTLEGQLSNIRKGLFTQFAMAEIDKWPAMEKLKKALGEIEGLFATDSKEGAKMMAAVKSYTTGLATMFGMVGKAMWAISYPARLVVGLIGKAMDTIQDYNFQGLFDVGAWKRLGVDMVLGIVEGVKSAATSLYGAVSEVAGGAVDAVRDKLGIRSPSRVMMAQGAYAAEGFARGLAGGSDMVQAAGRAISDVDIAPSFSVSPRDAGNKAGSGAGITIQNTFQIGSVQDPASFVRDVGPLLDAQIELSADRYFGRLLAQGAG